MADNYTGTTHPQSIVDEIFMDVYAEANTLKNNYINIDLNHKSSTEVTETTTSVIQ